MELLLLADLKHYIKMHEFYMKSDLFHPFSNLFQISVSCSRYLVCVMVDKMNSSRHLNLDFSIKVKVRHRWTADHLMRFWDLLAERVCWKKILIFGWQCVELYSVKGKRNAVIFKTEVVNVADKVKLLSWQWNMMGSNSSVVFFFWNQHPLNFLEG